MICGAGQTRALIGNSHGKVEVLIAGSVRVCAYVVYKMEMAVAGQDARG